MEGTDRQILFLYVRFLPGEIDCLRTFLLDLVVVESLKSLHAVVCIFEVAEINLCAQ